jgi:hypothetical protein
MYIKILTLSGRQKTDTPFAVKTMEDEEKCLLQTCEDDEPFHRKNMVRLAVARWSIFWPNNCKCALFSYVKLDFLFPYAMPIILAKSLGWLN